MAYKAVTTVGNTVTLYNKETKEEMTITVIAVNGPYFKGNFDYTIEGFNTVHNMDYSEYGKNYEVVL